MSELRRWMVLLCAAALAAAMIGCGGGGHGDEAEPIESAGVGPGGEAVAELEPKSGSEVTGQAVFTLDPEDKVTLFLSLQNLPPGEHAVHLHEFGDCSADDGSSAGGHWNPMGVDHGRWEQMPFHLGDIGNVEADEYGNGTLTLTTSLWTIGTGSDDDIVGKAIVVHAAPDDFATQPTGGAGGRIACGVIAVNTY